MWCNKYKKFRFDRWAIKKTVQEFVFVHYTDWTVVILLHLYIKPSLKGLIQMENEEVPLEDTFLLLFYLFFYFFLFFAQSRAGSHSYLCQKTAFRPLSSRKTERKKKKDKHAQHYPLTARGNKKLQHSLISDVTTRRGIHFETLVICTFYIHFCMT